ncbi:MAG: hypothetical protein E6Q97_37065 [Desulfurellales bacterium]|nr:MAG: hypothetical protein E6Q97_37065 [Desulfurellales bacterium]
MTPKELNLALAERYGGDPKHRVVRNINRAIRTLPGGNEVLDALTIMNASRNHAHSARAHDRVMACDAAIDKLETIRNAMETHILKTVRAS